MNYKKKLLTILLLTALMLTLSAQTSDKSKTTLDNDLGIDLDRTFSGEEVKILIDTLIEEADKSIDKAYKDGYKQAVVELQPEVEYWKTMYNSNKKSNITDSLKYTLIGLGSGFIIGGCSGFAIGWQIPSQVN